MDRILFLENDEVSMELYVQALRAVFEVELRNEVNRAVDDFRDLAKAGAWAGAVLDIMMPPGRFVGSSPTGMTTGWAVFQELRKIQPGLPVIAITNSNDEKVKEWFRPVPGVKVLDKLDLLPHELVAHARDMFSPADRAAPGNPSPPFAPSTDPTRS